MKALGFLKWLGGAVGYLLFTLLVLLLFLWLLFPEDVARRQLVKRLSGQFPGVSWKMESVALRFPPALVIRSIEGRRGDKGRPLLVLDALTLRPQLMELIRRGVLPVDCHLELAEGRAKGTVTVDPAGEGPWPIEGAGTDIALAKIPLLAALLDRKLDGRLAFDFRATVQPSSGRMLDLEGRLRVDDGRLELKKSVLGHAELPFSHGSLVLQLREGRVDLDKGEVESPLFSGQFKGSLALDTPLAASLVEVRGNLKPRPEFFAGIKASPAFEAVRTRLKDSDLPFLVSGELANPGIHFEDFSMLFDALDQVQQ